MKRTKIVLLLTITSGRISAHIIAKADTETTKTSIEMSRDRNESVLKPLNTSFVTTLDFKNYCLRRLFQKQDSHITEKIAS